MSEEELKVIERFKKIREETDIANRCGLSTNDFKEDLETYDAILNLIEKQQKELENSVSKDKIRDKIKELENRAKEYGYYKTEIEYARNTLQEIIGNRIKINELIKAIKQLDKKIK